MTRRRRARRLPVLLAVAVAVLAPAAPAAADAPQPTDYRSRVLNAAPPLPDGMAAQVVGGDSFLELTVPEGHTVVVPDYAAAGDDDPAPYLRFQADGTVERNRLAVATAANESRFGTADRQPDRQPDPGADPEWETVATGGTYAWHDHRIHWMSPTDPRGVDDDGRVDLGGPDGTWAVPLVVDGTATTITGELVLLDAPSPLPWIALGVVVAALVVLTGLRWGLRATTAAGIASSAAAVGAAWATWSAAPPSTGVSVVPVLVAVTALLASVVATWAPPRVQVVATAAAAAALVGWALTRWTVLTRAVLPTELAFGVDRAVTAAALGTGAAIAVVLLWKPPVRSSPSA